MNKVDYIRNVKFNFVCLRPGEEDKFGKFGLQIEFSADRRAELQCFGSIKVLDNGNLGINLNTQTKYGTGTKRAGQVKHIPIINTSKEELTERVGDGSVGDVKVFTYASQSAHNGMKSAPMAVLVRTFEKYVPNESDDFDLGEAPVTTQEVNDNF